MFFCVFSFVVVIWCTLTGLRLYWWCYKHYHSELLLSRAFVWSLRSSWNNTAISIHLEEDCQNFKNVWEIIIFIVTSRAASLSPVPPPSTAGTLPRPGTKQVTVTVQETVVEPAQQPLPPPPAAVVTTTRQHHASSATKELDDLMASLSDFKVSVTCVINLHKSSLPPPLK